MNLNDVLSVPVEAPVRTSALECLGRYQLEEFLGEGAMAQVYRARDPQIGRDVAVKVLKPTLARDPELAARFLREARAAGALSHPAIATIYDVGQCDGNSYIAMELVAGEPLDAVLNAQGRMACDRVLAIGRQLAAALGYAHRHGVVHRDIKPSNILLSTTGDRAKVVDFGVARITDARPGDTDQTLVRTQIGGLVGTPRYMSPEQALGLPVDHRSDLFSLGVVLYEMVTGKVAFPGTALATLAIQIAQTRVEPINRSIGDCPPGLMAVIDKLLAKKPEQRFATGDELERAIEREISARQDIGDGRRLVSLKLKLPLALLLVTSIALGICTQISWTREQRTLDQMALTSGQSIATFIAKNAAVGFADNASLPPAQQDWSVLQAFAATARTDPEVSDIVFTDRNGIVRAAGDTRLIGSRRQNGRPSLDEGRPASLVSPAGHRATELRIAMPVTYAGATVGAMDLVMKRTAVNAALDGARWALGLLTAAVLMVVLVAGYVGGAMVAKPLARLRTSLDEAARSGFAVRLSHNRRDEFGAVFDAFNTTAEALEPILRAGAATPVDSMAETRIVSTRQNA